MLLLPFKKLLFGEQLGLSLPVGEQGEAGQGGNAAPDVIPCGVRRARAWPLFCATGPVPMAVASLDLVVPGTFRDERLVAGRERLEARDEVTPGKRGDLCSGMAVAGTHGWQWHVWDTGQSIPGPEGKAA